MPVVLFPPVLIGLALGCSGAGSTGRDGDVGDGALDSDGVGEAGDSVDDGPYDVPFEVPDAPSNCGDGVVDPGEECDDGNRLDGDGCDWSCRLGDGVAPDPPDDSTPTVRREGNAEPVDGSWDGSWPEDCYRIPFLWTDDSYAVVWLPAGGVARITRFDRSGARVGVEWDLPSTGVYDAAWNGSGFAVTWCGDASGDASTQWLQILGADGKPEGAAVLLASRPGETCHATTVDWDGDGYSVFSIWSYASLRYARTDETGTIVTPDELVYDAADRELQCLAGAAGGGTAAAAVWVHVSADVDRTEYSVVASSGEALREAARLADVPGGPPKVEWDGRQFGLLTFGSPEEPGLYLARLSPEGDLLGPPSRLDTGMARDLALAAGLGWAATWGNGLTLIRTDPEGRVVQRVASGASDWTGFTAWGISLAFDGEGFGMLGMVSGAPWMVRFVLETP